jgi:hypothetical protein
VELRSRDNHLDWHAPILGLTLVACFEVAPGKRGNRRSQVREPKFPIFPTYRANRITSECSTVLCCSMQLDNAIGFEDRAMDHWR